MRVVLAMAAAMVCLAAGGTDRSKPVSHTVKDIEGWVVRVDDRLLAAENAVLGTRAIRLLEEKLGAIKSVMASDRVERLQRVTIVLDLSHGMLRSMQYHPSGEWLVGHGYARDLAKCVHIPQAADFVNPRHNSEQPWCVLHELAHAYHDQVFGFDEPEIKHAWQKYKDSKRGESVLHVAGRNQRHYALTNQMEFFAEMSEAYFGMNDFFPFNRGELKTAEREIYDLMEGKWGGMAWETPAKKAAR